jgi:hypothetical protein
MCEQQNTEHGIRNDTFLNTSGPTVKHVMHINCLLSNRRQTTQAAKRLENMR